ncbi:hypothetical protein CQY20_34060 [Mycolicibacterium agri]|uniref:PD-(D/E)XK endonuclease-like domain-containing protein n=2 Tax=Mycolicibacterium agri TaxID=36811 RepID=A0A2A7MMQ0_MYCAG|nr:hypothetical protein CQY20_34060 [Mycolicibacterium agri]GFG52302.1 hypothetical protein MAGR_37430 [Mycolicibacterium agri]
MQEADRNGLTVELLEDGRATESRLKVQEPLLAEAIRSYVGIDGSALVEEPLYDDENCIWGTVDLLLESDYGITIIDLKSGADAAKESLPEKIIAQLMLYALLVSPAMRMGPV